MKMYADHKKMHKKVSGISKYKIQISQQQKQYLQT